MSLVLPINGDAIRETFQAWNAERDSLDAQLSESLSALTAYQSHLDAWQQQLARERDDLRTAREQIERDQASCDKSQTAAATAMAADLHAARDKITSLTTLLLNRTEELRTLDNRRAELQTELELARAKEKERIAALDEQQRAVEQERAQWSAELRQLRDLLERQLDTPPPEAPAAPVTAPLVHPQSAGKGAHIIPCDNPLLGSIVEQFGKLRQQRAVERHANKSR